MITALFIPLLLLFLANLIPLLLIYFETPTQILFALITLLILSLVFLQKKVFTTSENKHNQIGRLFFLFLSSLFIELLIVTTGGFYSSFFALLHFYAFALGALVNLRTATIFIFLSALSLLIQINIDPRVLAIWNQDPNGLILYLLSYFIIIPFSYYLAGQFQLKDKLTHLLEKEVQVNKVILREISEMIIVTNLQLDILSVSDVVEKVLKVTRNELVGKQIFDVLFLRSEKGELINPNLLLINQLIKEKTVTKIENLDLYVKNSTQPLKVQLSVKFVPDFNGSIEQLTFIISLVTPIEKMNIQTTTEEFLFKQIYQKQQLHLEDLRSKLITQNLAPLANHIYLIENWTQDIALLNDLNKINKLDKNYSTIDLAQLLNNIVHRNQKFTNLLNVSLSFHLLNFSYQDIAAHVPKDKKVALMDMTSLFFNASVMVNWFDVMIHKLIFITTLLSLSSPEKSVHLSIERYDQNILKISVSVEKLQFIPQEKELLFTQGYGSLSSTTNLYFSSGVEGILSQKIAKEMNSILNVEYNQETKTLSFILFIDKRTNQS